MSYHLCPNCGQKALTVATRCPRCGLPFETQFFQHQASGPRPRRIPPGFLIAGAVVAVLVANAVLSSRSVAPPVGLPRTATDSAPRHEAVPRPPRESLGAAAESLRAAPSPVPQPANQSPAPAADSTGSAAPIPSAEAIGTVAPQRRYASTWTNVRARRSNTAPVVRILRPGEVVLVDSLEEGWYQVVIDRQALGYVDQRYLATAPPPPTP